MKRVYLIFVLAFFLGNIGQAIEIEKPQVIDGAFATIAVSDLHGFIDEVGIVASKVTPMMNGMMLKNMIGSQIGDPQLTSIAPGKGLAVVMLDPETFFAVIEMDETKSGTCTNELMSIGMQFKYADGVLVLAETVDELEKGVAQAAAIKKSLFSKRSPALRLALKPSECIAKNDEQIQGMLAMMPMMMGMGLQQDPSIKPDAVAGIIRVIEAEVQVFLSLAKQVESAEIIVLPSNGSLRINEIITPVPDSNLDAYCNSPKVNKENSKLQSGMLENGAIKIDFCFSNVDALSSLASSEAEKLITTMDLGEAPLIKGYIEMLKNWASAYGGTGCEVIRVDKDKGFAVDFLWDIKDEEKALVLMKNMPAELETMGLIQLYKDMGMPMSFNFKEAVRKHGDVTIHQLGITMPMKDMPEEQKKSFEAMGMTNMSYEVAFVDGALVGVMNGGIEKRIDAVKNPKPNTSKLQARNVYPANAGYYFDIDVSEYLGFALFSMPETERESMQQIATGLKGAEPVSGAAFRDNGCLMWSVNMPSSLIAKMGQVIMMQQMQQQVSPDVESTATP